MSKFIDENYKDEELQRSLKEFLNENMETKTYFQIRDKAGEITNDKKEWCVFDD